MMATSRTVARTRTTLGYSLVAFVATMLGCAADDGNGRFGGGGGINVEDDGADGSSDDPDGDGDGDGGDGGDGGGADDGGDDDGGGVPNEPPANEPEIPFDPAKLSEVCARGNGDRVAQALCNGASVHSLAELRETLAFISPFFALTGNSSSIVAREVNALNPRLIVGDRVGIFGDFPGAEEGTTGLLAMGFARGDQFVELVGYDPNKDDLNFYLLMFEQGCNESEDGCSTADLVSPAVETDWTRWTLYQDTDLVNTTLDCNTCHQPLGPGTPKVPRMQEVANSWTHWFPTRPPPPEATGGGGGWGSPSGGSGTSDGVPPQTNGHGTSSSEILWDMFSRMHAGEEAYGGVPLAQISESTAGPDMESFMANYLLFREVPAELQFPGFGEQEMEAGGSDYFCDSADMEQAGADSTWSDQYARVLGGQRLPLPSHRIDITFEPSREAAIKSYQKYMLGEIAAEDMMDPRQVTEAKVMTELSSMPRQGASGQEILTHMCARCHNAQLDQTLTRARFDATSVWDLGESEKASILDRLTRDHDDSKLMPPARFGTLPQWAIDEVTAWLATQ